MRSSLGSIKNLPTYDTVLIELTKDRKLDNDIVDKTIDALGEIKESTIEPMTLDYLVDTTEHRFQEVVLEKTVMKAASMLGGEDKRIRKSELPDMFRDALKLSFKNTIGDAYGTQKSIEDQFYYYHHKDKQFPMPDFATFNEVTRGGFKKKHIIVIQAGTNVGKTLCLEAIAEQYLKAGQNCLYLSAEISEEELKERFDGNILQTSTEHLDKITKDNYVTKLKDYMGRSEGRLIIKQYPTATANVLHVRALLDESRDTRELQTRLHFP